jgi:hypothetical protein
MGQPSAKSCAEFRGGRGRRRCVNGNTLLYRTTLITI